MEAFVRAATCQALPEPGAVFNIASGSQTTLAELVNVAARVFDVSAEPGWGTMAARGWDTSVWVGDPRAAAEHLGWRASTPLADGLARFGEWLASPESRGPIPMRRRAVEPENLTLRTGERWRPPIFVPLTVAARA